MAALHTVRWPLAQASGILAVAVARLSILTLIGHDQSCLDALSARFPGSMRVGRLEGMLHEAKGNTVVASNLYRALLEKDETNMVTRNDTLLSYML